ncbi:MAG: DNA recombination protein RmuC [Deltaproteobacteria bacterium]|nr:DNA recombination protein RmuC [Deltaproteobacteria bacterium]
MTWLSPILSGVTIVLLIILMLLNKSSHRGIERLEQAVRAEFRSNRGESARAASDLRKEISSAQRASMETMIQTMDGLGRLQRDKLDSVERRIKELTESNETRIDKLRNTLDSQLASLQQGNEAKLDQMRQIVDDRLQKTLEKRLGESFKIVSERLEAVQRGLGEMQNLATGVGDLKRVLTNVKARGTWGEVQLGALLEQILTPDQYGKNVRTREGSQETVEYAIRLPGRGKDLRVVWLPIDSKFPQEDYLRLVSAADAADVDAVEKATTALTRAVQSSAKDISHKYLDPPRTTDFAIMFLPTEGLYAEILRQPGLMEDLQQTSRVVVAGPTTLSAILSSLRMGFRTLAIEKRSSEVWKILAAVKTEFGRFGDVLTKVKKQLDTASNTIDQTGVRTRAMKRKLREVEQLPVDVSEKLLGISEQGTVERANAERKT